MQYCLFTEVIKAGATTFSDKVGFGWSRFEEGANFRRSKFDAEVSFYGATIDGDLNLSGTTISGRLNLRKVAVEGDILLQEATIEGDLELAGADISGEVKLRNATIEGALLAENTTTGKIDLTFTRLVGPWLSSNHDIESVELRSTHFESIVTLVKSSIRGSFDCNVATFEGGLLWVQTTAEGPVRILNSQLEHTTKIHDSELQGPLVFRHSDMGHHLQLSELDCLDEINLAGTELGSFTALYQLQIDGELNAGAANAAGVIRFTNVEVTDDVNLTDLAVDEHLEIHSCTFDSNFDLSESVVNEYIGFRGGSFRSNLTAQYLHVGRNLELIDSNCSKTLDFTDARIGTLYIDDDTVTDSLCLERTHVTNRSADLAGIKVHNQLLLDDAEFSQNLRLGNSRAGAISMEETTVKGDIIGRNLTVGSISDGGSIRATGIEVSCDIQFEAATVHGLFDIEEGTIKGEMNTDQLTVAGVLSLSNAHLCGSVGGSGTTVGGLNLTGATFESNVLFTSATVKGDVDGSQATSTGPSITLFNARVNGSVSFENAELAGDLVVADCRLPCKESAGNLLLKSEAGESSPKTPQTAIDLRTARIDGQFLIEDSYLRDDVDANGAKPHMVTLKNTAIDGGYYVDETEIDETLTITGSNVFDGVIGTDLRINSKCKLRDITTKEINFDDALFKWDVKITNSLIGQVSLRNATLRNELQLHKVMAYNGRIHLNHARVSDISITWPPGSTVIECTQARLGNLRTDPPENELLWDRLHIDRTEFDRFDFADFTTSLSHTNYLIHRDEQRSLRARYLAFLPTFIQHARQGSDNDLSKIIDEYESREVTYRRAKDSADTTGDNPAASKFYMHEKKYRRRRRFWATIRGEGSRLRNVIAWGTNLSLGLLAGHGERAIQVGLSAIGVIVFFALLLTVGTTLLPDASPLNLTAASEQALRTLVGAPSLIGKPEASGYVKLILLVERAVGIALIPLLVFALTRSLRR